MTTTPEPKPECADDDHDWHFISDWYGDPGVVNGTADCSYWKCRTCGKEDHESEAPEYEPWGDEVI